MQTRDPAYGTRIREMFRMAPFIAHLGVEVRAVEPGRVHSALTPRAEHLQQDGYVHAGVISTLADHTAGGAAGTLIAPEQIVLTSEFKIHLLRPVPRAVTEF